MDLLQDDHEYVLCSMINSVYIINKAGGLIYDEDFSLNKYIEEHTWQEHPIPLVFTADTGRVLVKFGEVCNLNCFPTIILLSFLLRAGGQAGMISLCSLKNQRHY